ncbi:hypothetical protein CNBG_10101 [Cryptococcus deuterogattii R265]|uniref:uncharacterized protein n=1 Tax=Cryptococcus deuterogattii (strain R265) TaxID=294750 RepID=UPI00193860F9|nr:hypothetical protein CNBG_10101 [Cryptococcus deuterogattii R265]
MKRLYGVVRLFEPWRSQHPYWDFCEDSSLEVQLWQYGLLGSPRVILLDKTAPGCMVPIALASIPIYPRDRITLSSYGHLNLSTM